MLNIGSFTYLYRVPTAWGKHGKWPKEIPVRKNTGNLEILPPYIKFLIAHVDNFLILKIQDIAIFAAKF